MTCPRPYKKSATELEMELSLPHSVLASKLYLPSRRATKSGNNMGGKNKLETKVMKDKAVSSTQKKTKTTLKEKNQKKPSTQETLAYKIKEIPNTCNVVYRRREQLNSIRRKPLKAFH